MQKKRYFVQRVVISIVILLQLVCLVQAKSQQPSDNLAARFKRLKHGINLSHWFAQSSNYSQQHLTTHTTAEDIELIKKMGFDHVRFTVEPAPFINKDTPQKLNAEYLAVFDKALDMMLNQEGLAVIVDIHPSDEFKLAFKDNKNVEAFAQFWRVFAKHLSARDTERVFLEVINEPMVEDGYRWHGIQAKLITAIRDNAPRHTIIVSGHRWSGLEELLFMEPYSDQNLIYNFHFYEPFAFTHQAATWAGPNLVSYKNVPYPSTPENVLTLANALTDESARNGLLWYGKNTWNIAKLDEELSKAARWAAKHKVFVTCNEFGVYRRASPPADRAAWLRDMHTTLEKYNIGWTMWDYAGGFSVVNKQNGKATPDEMTVKALGLKSK